MYVCVTEKERGKSNRHRAIPKRAKELREREMEEMEFRQAND